MTVDLEAIARRQRCEASTLRAALPLVEQGYEPPFLTRYRRDELGDIPERALWEMVAAIRTDRQLEQRREELRTKYREGKLDDDALLASIAHAQTPRQLDRIARRIRREAGNAHPASRLAVRLLNPKPGDPVELSELAELVVGPEEATAAAEGLDTVLGQYLAADSRMVQAASRWMDKHVRLHVIEVHDPHEGSADAASESEDSEGEDHDDPSGDENEPNRAPASAPRSDAATATDAAAPQTEPPTGEAQTSGPQPAESQPAESQPDQPQQVSDSPIAGASTTPSDTSDVAVDASAGESLQAGENTAQAGAAEQPAAEQPAAEQPAAEHAGAAEAAPAGDAGAETASEKASEPAAAAKKSQSLSGAGAATGSGKAKKKEAPRKKISPRQRRRRWLVSVLQPLSGKSLPKAKLTAFQVVMLGRALRSQVARCAFKYDAAELVDLLARTAAGFNKEASSELSQIVIDNEAAIREALEGAWWDDLIDRAARRLISIAADSLRRQMHREPIEAQNVLVIDAVGPRTAAIAVVGPDDGVLHTEDLPCQLSKAVRQQLVARLGELVHQYHVDLIVLSNGPARRSCMVALSELLAHSEGGSLRWTLADRAGAETYAGGPDGNRELRSTPRRFRAAVWLAQLVRTPARALAKVDPSKLRLGSYQRELAEKPLLDSLQDVVTSGVSQISVDTNAADRGWLASLPGVNAAVAEAIDRHRRQSLFTSREEVLSLDAWPDAVASRQAAGFLRVFGGPQPLDATAIHPDDYALAEKLMARLEIPAPPSAPPGYEPPRFDVDEAKAAVAAAANEGPKFTEVKIAQVDPDAPFGAIPEHGSPENGSPESGSPAEQEATGASEAEPAAETEASAESVAEPAAEATPSAEAASEPASSEPTAEEAAAEEAAAGDTEQAAPAAETSESAAAEEPSSTPAPQAPAAPEPYRHPLPDNDKLLRCVKEWQVGEHRVRHIVRSLCDPFRDTGSTDAVPAAAMAAVPKLTDLKPGTPVAGVVVGVAGFGVFVELGPECSGLIHVSRISEDYVEDLNEYVQIGDVVTAWVTEIDSKRRRVALSGVSPERQAALRQQRPERAPRGGARGGGRGAAAGGGQAARGGDKPAGAGGGRPAGAGGRGERTHATGGRDSRGGGAAGRGGARGGGQGRGASRDAKRSRGPTTYTTVARSDKPAAPISDAMKTGDEPLRSFGDLMQFFQSSRGETAPAANQGKGKKSKQRAADKSPEGTPSADDSGAAEPPESPAAPGPSSSAPPQSETPPAETGGHVAEGAAPKPEARDSAQPHEAPADEPSSGAAAEEGAASGTDRTS